MHGSAALPGPAARCRGGARLRCGYRQHLHRDLRPAISTHKYRKSREEVLEDALDMVEYASDHGVKVRFAAEDASRTDPAFLVDMYNQGAECGCRSAQLC